MPRHNNFNRILCAPDSVLSKPRPSFWGTFKKTLSSKHFVEALFAVAIPVTIGGLFASNTFRWRIIWIFIGVATFLLDIAFVTYMDIREASAVRRLPVMIEVRSSGETEASDMIQRVDEALRKANEGRLSEEYQVALRRDSLHLALDPVTNSDEWRERLSEVWPRLDSLFKLSDEPNIFYKGPLALAVALGALSARKSLVLWQWMGDRYERAGALHYPEGHSQEHPEASGLGFEEPEGCPGNSPLALAVELGHHAITRAVVQHARSVTGTDSVALLRVFKAGPDGRQILSGSLDIRHLIPAARSVYGKLLELEARCGGLGDVMLYMDGPVSTAFALGWLLGSNRSVKVYAYDPVKSTYDLAYELNRLRTL